MTDIGDYPELSVEFTSIPQPQGGVANNAHISYAAAAASLHPGNQLVDDVGLQRAGYRPVAGRGHGRGSGSTDYSSLVGQSIVYTTRNVIGGVGRGRGAATQDGVKTSQRPGRRGGRQGGGVVNVTPNAVKRTIDKKFLRDLSKKEAKVVTTIVSSYLVDFERTIGKTEIVGKQEVMSIVIQILLKVATVANDVQGEEQGMASTIIAEILSERSEKFIMLLKRAVQNTRITILQAESFSQLFQCILARIESVWECLPIDELLDSVKRITKAGTINPKLYEMAENLCVLRDEIRDKKVNPTAELCIVDSSGYKNIPILPEWEDIKEDNGTPPEVRPNKLAGPYKDWMEYYDIQFRLLREDFIASLRRGVSAHQKGESSKRNRDIKTYNEAKIVSQVTTREMGICFEIQFNVNGFRRINYNWNVSKRLIFGSLVLFVPSDKTNSDVVFATVAGRENVREGKLLVCFESDILKAMNHKKKCTIFEMVESSSYFEAVRPILCSIQRAKVETMPFTKQLIYGDCGKIQSPVYLRANQMSFEVAYNLRCLYGSMKGRKNLLIQIFNNESWEKANDSELDSSQLHAIRAALTQEIAVIQGPPGTGKTYIGLKIVEALLENRKVWDPCKTSPILVMCYTNHALDQFLEGIIKSKCNVGNFEVLRVGGRCKNETVEPYNIKKLRKQKKMHGTYSCEIGRLLRELRYCNPQMAMNKLESYCNRGSLLDLTILRTVVDPDHYYQLTQIVRCKEQKGNEAEVWLDLWTNKSPPNSTRANETTVGIIEVNSRERHVKRRVVGIDSEAAMDQDEHMDEHDEEGYKIVDSFEENTELNMYSEYCHEEFSDDDTEDEIMRFRKTNANQLIKKNINRDGMDEDEVQEVKDINELNVKDRWRLYNYWENERLKYLESENKKLVNDYTEKCKKLAELRQLEDGERMANADVIGMTTSGAAKHQHILQDIKPKIVIVEEAAEVLEAHIVSALSAGTQHLILIGDHKQLRPKPNEHVLATKFNLSISLFERLVMKGMSQATLEIQHRMRPEIARLVCPHIYEKLVNHESVKKYPDIRGISKNMYFICHTEPESENQAVQSHENESEANYIVALYGHLLKLGYRPSQITILTPYVGQLLNLRNKMPKKDFEGVRVLAIDNFQGEENDIILFSMVRSTNPKSSRTTIGFVKEDNRACVSLSRAKQGFYAIGNFELIRHQTPLWESIISDVEKRDCYGDALPLYCCNHPDIKYSAKKDTDFITNARHGGCNKKCDIRLKCGHSCIRTCHVADIQHTDYKCMKSCLKHCKDGHPCKSLCHMLCPRCQENVTKQIPRCGHYQRMKCSDNPNDVKCREIVTKIIPQCGHRQDMPCSTHPSLTDCQSPCVKSCKEGHPCQKRCYKDCGECSVLVEKIIPFCGHGQLVPCHLPPDYFSCKAPCPKLCSTYQHPCKKFCGENCSNCTEFVQKIVPNCEHPQIVMCYREPDPANCLAICVTKCPKGSHTLTKKCNEKWPKCKELVQKILPECGHDTIAECSEDSSSIKCTKPCARTCDKGHDCHKKCHEECGPCEFPVTKLLECGHTHNMSCFKESTNTFKCPTQCSKPICHNDHKCPIKCHFPRPCGECNELVVIKLSRCSHENRVKCFKSQNMDKYRIKCEGPCEKKLSCGHTCRNKCSEKCQAICSEKVLVGLPCGHHTKMVCGKSTATVKCFQKKDIKLKCGHSITAECWKQKDKNALQKQCKENCKKLLVCGHPCKEICSKPCTSHCKRNVTVTLQCGHEIKVKCFQPKSYYQCTNQCLKKLPCGHTCLNQCGKPCSTCHLKSRRSYPCGHTSKIPCNSSIEDYPCKKGCKKILSCGHRCSGKCGDCSSTRIHTICKFDIKIRRFCGHEVTLPCAGLSDSCERTHTIPCTHNDDSSKCLEVCGWDCKHLKCKKDCREMCVRLRCNKPCDKKLPCGHICPGLCGEWCLSLCQHCDPAQFIKQLYPKPKRGKIPINERFYELNCHHIFTVKYLDEYMKPTHVVAIKQCPKCNAIIEQENRYGNVVREAKIDVENIRRLLTRSPYTEDRAKKSKILLESFQWVKKPHYYGIKNSSCVIAIQTKLRDDQPVTEEEIFLVKCSESYCALYDSLISYETDASVLRNLMNAINTLIDSAQAKLQPAHEFNRLPPANSDNINLSWQLIEDFLSELYRLTLFAQCKTAMRDTPHYKCIVSVEHFLKSLNPLNDRISETEYEEHFRRISSVFPATSHIHVNTPRMPVVVKGTWMKCSLGHYYCVRPFCGVRSELEPCCHCVKKCRQ